MLKVYALLWWTNVIMACVLVVFQVNTKDEKKQETEYMYFYRAKLQTFWTHYGMNYATTHKYKHTHTHSLKNQLFLLIVLGIVHMYIKNTLEFNIIYDALNSSSNLFGKYANYNSS